MVSTRLQATTEIKRGDGQAIENVPALTTKKSTKLVKSTEKTEARGIEKATETTSERHAESTSSLDIIESIADVFTKDKRMIDDGNKEHDEHDRYTQASNGAMLSWKPEVVLPKASEASTSKSLSQSSIEIKHGSFCRSRPNPGKKNPAAKKLSDEWFELPTQEITDEVKTDLRVLRLRSTFDPKQFYKKFDDTKFPKKFQFGTVVESAADFYSSRLSNKERKRTMADEILHDSYLTSVRKKRYHKIQEETSYWSKKGYGRKTDNERLRKKPRKSKH